MTAKVDIVYLQENSGDLDGQEVTGVIQMTGVLRVGWRIKLLMIFHIHILINMCPPRAPGIPDLLHLHGNL